MTAVAKWRRSTAAERRAAREAYRALKQAVENSPETAKRRATYRHDATRARALGKIRRMLAGRGSPIFSAAELAVVKPAELEKLRQASAGRYAALSQGQRDRLRDNLFILLVTISTADYETAADFDPPNAVVDSTRQANLTV